MLCSKCLKIDDMFDHFASVALLAGTLQVKACCDLRM
jgi:hypothetical protein